MDPKWVVCLNLKLSFVLRALPTYGGRRLLSMSSLATGVTLNFTERQLCKCWGCIFAVASLRWQLSCPAASPEDVPDASSFSVTLSKASLMSPSSPDASLWLEGTSSPNSQTATSQPSNPPPPSACHPAGRRLMTWCLPSNRLFDSEPSFPLPACFQHRGRWRRSV